VVIFKKPAIGIYWPFIKNRNAIGCLKALLQAPGSLPIPSTNGVLKFLGLKKGINAAFRGNKFSDNF
jgi:hypothetical protein